MLKHFSNNILKMEPSYEMIFAQIKMMFKNLDDFTIKCLIETHYPQFIKPIDKGVVIQDVSEVVKPIIIENNISND